jgi:CheY-like chemotaxis protein
MVTIKSVESDSIATVALTPRRLRLNRDSPTRRARPPSVLVVDDDSSCLSGVRRILSRMGYCVHTETSGVRALEHFANHGADVVLADVMMPTMNGLDLARKLREVRPDLAVIIFTGGPLPGMEECGRLEQGGIPILSKPLAEDHLEVALRKVLGDSDEFWGLWPGGF